MSDEAKAGAVEAAGQEGAAPEGPVPAHWSATSLKVAVAAAVVLVLDAALFERTTCGVCGTAATHPLPAGFHAPWIFALAGAVVLGLVVALVGRVLWSWEDPREVPSMATYLAVALVTSIATVAAFTVLGHEVHRIGVNSVLRQLDPGSPGPPR